MPVFSRCPTERGVKHVKGLIQAHKEGYQAFLLFLIQMKGISYFPPTTPPIRPSGMRYGKPLPPGLRF